MSKPCTATIRITSRRAASRGSRARCARRWRSTPPPKTKFPRPRAASADLLRRQRSAALKTYIVFEPENARAGDAGERTEFVREKFSWMALLFAPFWLLYNRLWLAFVLFCAAEILIASALYFLGLAGLVGAAA